MTAPRRMPAIAIAFGALLVATDAQAAKLLKADAILDGSLQPPGDRIDVTLFLDPDEPDAEIQIRPFVFADGVASPIRARGAEHRADDGTILVTANATRDQKDGVSERGIPVAYADLDLSAGTHEIGYEVSIVRNGEILVVQATPLSRVTVGEGTRTEVRRATPARIPTRTTTVPATILGERTRGGGDGEIQSQTLRMTAPAPVGRSEIQIVRTRIPGQFEREASPIDAPRPGPSSPLESELKGLQGKPFLMAAQVLPREQRTIRFATNRAQLPPTEQVAVAFGSDVAAELACGECLVNFPIQHHRKGQLERPTWWEKTDPGKHVTLEEVSVSSLEKLLEDSSERDVLVYVHGFNNSFEAAMLRAAQMQYDLEFAGTMIAFSWPSLGALDQYEADAVHANESVSALADLLRGLIEQRSQGDDKSGRINIISHSMGNRVFLEALFELHRDGAIEPDTRPFNQIILAAPDLGAARFNNISGFAASCAAQVTYYYCTNDAALAVSRKLNAYEPVGLFPLFMPGLRTINADGVDTSFLNHGYFSSSPQVLLDLQLMIDEGLPPDERMPPLVSRSVVFGQPHWSFTEVDVEVIESRR